MPETPVGPTADGARQDVARLAELFRQSFAALDADARAAGRRWAGEIDRELGRIGEVGLRADTRKALSDIRSLDKELNRDRALNIGADMHAGAALGDVPGSGGGGLMPLADAITAASSAAGGLAAAVGGVVGVVGALGNSVGQMRGPSQAPGILPQPSVSGAAPSMGSIPTPDAVGSPPPPDLATPLGFAGVSDASAAPAALSGLGALVDGLSRIGGAGVPGNVSVAPPSLPSASGSQGVAGAVDGAMPSIPSAPGLGIAAPPVADVASSAGSPVGGVPTLQGPTQSAPVDSGLSGLGDALNGIKSLTGGLPTGDLGGGMSSLPSPASSAGFGSALPSPRFGGEGGAAMNPSPQMPGANPLGAVNGNYPPGTPSSAAVGGAGGQRSSAGVLNLSGGGSDGRGTSPLGGVAGGRAALTSGRIDMGGYAQGLGAAPGSPIGDPMASAPTGPADTSPMVPAGVDGNQLSILGALFPGYAGVTNNQSNATFNINGGGNKTDMDLFMSFWREFGRIGGLVGAVGSFLQ